MWEFKQKPDIKFVREKWNTVEAALLDLAYEIHCCENHLKWIDFYIKKLTGQNPKEQQELNL